MLSCVSGLSSRPATQVRCDDTGVTHSSAAEKRSVWVILTNFFDAA